MEREILFRGYSNDIQKWVYGSYLNDPTSGVPVIIREDGFDNRIKVNPETIGQFSGINDIEGNKIFEGDIIKIPDDWDTYGWYADGEFEIIFSHGGFRLKPTNKNAKGGYLEHDKEFSVIGTIYKGNSLKT